MVSRATGNVDFQAGYGNQYASGYSPIRLSGRNKSVGSSFVVCSLGGKYQMPQVSGATKLRVRGGDAQDSPAGTGARSVVVIGLSTLGEQIEETILTNGSSLGPTTVNEFIRVFKVFVKESGSYSSVSPIFGSHAGEIIIVDETDTDVWAIIDADDYPKGESEIGYYTVPLGFRAYIPRLTFTEDSNQTANISLFARENSLQESVPFSPNLAIESFSTVNDEIMRNYEPYLGFKALTDIGALCKVSGGPTECSIQISIVLCKWP